MKLSIATAHMVLAISLSYYSTGVVSHEACTHGKLFVSSISDTTIRVFDLNNGLENVALDFTVDISEAGPKLNLTKDSTNMVVSVIYRGTVENLYQVRPT
jgi:WD40 repeat protein